MWYRFIKIIGFCGLSQQTHQITVSSHSEKNLGLLAYETARDVGVSGFKKSRSNYQKYSPNERYNTD